MHPHRRLFDSSFAAVCGLGIRNEKVRHRGYVKTADLMPWLCYYFIQLPSAIRAISYSNDFCEEKKLKWHICPFFITLQENGFLSLQFIQLQIYSSGKSTIWYSLSLFFSPWSKSNYSKWLLMVIIATVYWSSGSISWKKKEKQTERQRALFRCDNICIVYLAFVKI